KFGGKQMTNITKDQLIELDKNYFLHPTSSIEQQQEAGPAIIFEKGEGIYLQDMDGKKYMEGMSSLWNVNIGYGRKEIAEVAKKQMEKLSFSSTFSTYSHQPVIKLASKIAELAPGNLNTVFFTSGGSEANDSAIKLVRHYWNTKGEPNRKRIVARKRGYHGVSMGATSATGISEFWNMTDLSPAFIHINPTSSNEFREVIQKEGAETIAAFIAEPIIGAGGNILPPQNYFKEIREICDEYGIICIASGYVTVGGIVMSDKIYKEIEYNKAGTLFPRFTYNRHSVSCGVPLNNIENMGLESIVDNALLMDAKLTIEIGKIEASEDGL